MFGFGLVKLGAAAAAGWAGAYLFDPSRGRARRAQLQDQARAQLRRVERRLEGRAEYERGRLHGARHRLGRSGPSPAPDDGVLRDRVRSEALGRLPDLARRVTIDVSGGEVTLRGQLDDGVDILHVEREVARVAGVERVVNLLHREGEPAPNKAEARRTGT